MKPGTWVIRRDYPGGWVGYRIGILGPYIDDRSCWRWDAMRSPVWPTWEAALDYVKFMQIADLRAKLRGTPLPGSPL